MFAKTIEFDMYRFTGIGWIMVPNDSISLKRANWHFKRMKAIGMTPALSDRIYTVRITSTWFGLNRTYQLIENI